MSTAEIVDVLGGKASLGLRGDVEAADLHERIQAGLPYKTLEHLTRRFALPKGPLAFVLALPPSTEVRRRRSNRLSPLESDRLYRVARILAHARRTFGNDEAASTWLSRANRALGGDVPFDQLRTELGAERVETILNRLDYGVVG
ncbi:MAG: antitoxin Xre/MbcA/ParS toxin-binding domain-containing protein [Vicinamibacterales bacterium]